MSESEARDKLIEKIRKLLALARKNPNINEAALAAAKAQELLLQYNLSEEDVGDIFKSREEKIIEQFYTGHRASMNEIQWKISLGWAVARNNLVKMIHHPSSRQISFIGKESNILVAQFLLDTLCQDLEAMADKLWKDILLLRAAEKKYGHNLFKDDTLRTIHGKSWKKSFFVGAVRAISERLTDNFRDLRTNNENINALVLTNDSAIQKYVEDHYDRLGTSRARRGSLNSAAYRSGYDVGKRIPFKRGMGTGGAAGPGLLKG